MAPRLRSLSFAVVLALAACAHDAASELPANAPCPYASANDGTQSYALLCQDPIAVHARVKHVLIGWTGLDGPGHRDAKAPDRSYGEAQALARDILAQLRAGAPIEPLMAKYSEDPGSAESGQFYEASPDAGLVSEFKALALRLQVGEAGIVKSTFGLHVIQRVK